MSSETPGARFTPHGSAALEAHLARVCADVRDGVRALIPERELLGLTLGGGYGRGEGGVLRTPEGERPYNDLEFYVLVPGSGLWAERRYRHALHDLGERLSPSAGLEVEFKVLGLGRLRRRAPGMFFYDLVVGHRWVVGDESLFDGCDAHRDPARIPLAEATRLVMNRGSGLLFAAERLQRPEFGPDDADFVGRNLAKAQLALGDAFLTAQGRYHWSCRERHSRLAGWNPGELPGGPALVQHHAAGVAFKFDPVRSTASRDDLRARHQEIVDLAGLVWCWLEGRRLGRTYSSPAAYAVSPEDKCPETSPWRNRLINARAFGAGAAFRAEGGRYPRERLLRSLGRLLWDPSCVGDPARRATLQTWLRTDAQDFAGLVRAYQGLWSRFQ